MTCLSVCALEISLLSYLLTYLLIQDCRRSLHEAEQREVAIMANGRKLKDEMETNLVSVLVYHWLLSVLGPIGRNSN